MPTSQHADPLIGRLVDERYSVRARIARGGMATVYVATDLRLERRVAIKVMHGHLSDDSVFQSRFIQEARAAARLADPHVVNVFDQGQDGDMAYLVMEYLPGITLRELLREQGRLSVPQTITIMDAILSGLSAAHRASIVHRDVKPENVLLAEDGRIKIGDFGLARATTANTATGQMLLGTIAYLAPELVTRGTADARSDIYALGILLYEMLTGEQPYKGEQPMQIAYQHATDSVPRPSIKNPAVPEQLDELVLWATERSPDDRPGDAREMLDRLRAIEKELGVFPHVVRTAPIPSAVDLDLDDGLRSDELTKVMPGAFTAPNVTPDVDHATRLRRRTQRARVRGGWLFALVILLTALAGGAGWWFGSGPGSFVPIPDVSGGTYDEAAAALRDVELVPTETSAYSVDIPVGRVVDTNPSIGTRVDRGSGVEVIVSLGPELHTVERLAGRAHDDAVAYLQSLDILIADEGTEYFTDEPVDSVVAATAVQRDQDGVVTCTDGCEIYAGSTVTLGVSLGPVPDVVGETEADATATLTGVNLDVAVDRVFDQDADEGTVIALRERTEPGWWRPQETITMVVSVGEFPDVVGDTLEDATAALDAVNVTVATAEEYSDDVATGRVIRIQEREGGGAWQPDDTVTLVVSLGPQPIEIPNVVGMTLSEAAAELRARGITFTTIFPEGILWNLTTVSSTSPGAGENWYRTSDPVRLISAG